MACLADSSISADVIVINSTHFNTNNKNLVHDVINNNSDIYVINETLGEMLNLSNNNISNNNDDKNITILENSVVKDNEDLSTTNTEATNQSQNNQSQTNQSQTNQSQTSQSQTNQSQTNQSQTNQSQTNQSQTNQSTSASKSKNNKNNNVHELYTAASGLYVCWLFMRVVILLATWLPRGVNAIAYKCLEWLVLVGWVVGGWLVVWVGGRWLG